MPLTAVWIGADGAGWLADRSLHASEVAVDLRGVSMLLDGSFGRLPLATKLLGRFNAENCGGGLGCLLSLGVPLERAVAALADCTAPPGRMEVIEPAVRGKPLAVIDYAHSPDALAKALAALREHCRGALWCVFGCGGDRDPGKRPMMGAVADELADRIIVTDDNPRSENPQEIVQRHHRRHQDRTLPGSSTIAARRLQRRSARPPPRTSCSSPAKGMRTTRSTARPAAVSAIAARRCGISERQHEAHLAERTARSCSSGRLIGLI